MSLPALAVTFDFGQTLVELDADLTAARLGELGLSFEPQRILDAMPAGWRAYNAAIQSGHGGHPWKILMRAVLEGAAPTGTTDADLKRGVDFLWDEQPKKNLWRKLIGDMMALVDDLFRAGVPLAILSNSEGRLAELVEELGITDRFVVIADSGKLGMEKPGREIFAWTAERLGVPLDRIVHIGDSYAADIEGALAAGERAIWFGGDPSRKLEERARVASDAAEVRRALEIFGVRTIAG